MFGISKKKNGNEILVDNAKGMALAAESAKRGLDELASLLNEIREGRVLYDEKLNDQILGIIDRIEKEIKKEKSMAKDSRSIIKKQKNQLKK